MPEKPKRGNVGTTLGADSLEAAQAAFEPTRMRILLLLAHRGPMCVGDIASGFEISRPAVSHHLKVLRTSGLVSRARTGQEIHYAARMGPIIHTLRSVADGLEQCCPRAGEE